MNVVAVDPGGATGFAFWIDGHFETFERKGGLAGAMDVLDGTIHAPAWDVIVVEEFKLGQQSRAMTKKPQEETLELIGAIKWAVCRANKIRLRDGVWRNGVTLNGAAHQLELVLQSPSDAKGFSTNDKLKAVGWKTPSNPDHERSAARHLLLYLTRTGAIDPLSLLQSLERA